MQLFLGILLLICCTPSTIVAAPHTKVRLLLSAETIRPGDTLTGAVVLNMEPGWHTYWRNPGESGGATEIEWQLPDGITAGEIQWPVPEKYDFEGLITYVYHDEAVLLVPLKVGNDVSPGPKTLAAKVSWLECKDLCLPGDGSVSANITIGDKTITSPDAESIQAAKKELPSAATQLEPRAFWEKDAAGDSRAVIFEWKGEAKNPDFFAYVTSGIDVLPAVEVLAGEPGKVRIRKTVKKLEGEWPTEISGLLVEDIKQGLDSPAYEVTAPISAADAKDTPASATAPSPSVSAPKESWPKMLLFAFLGGMILNIMPCVLPVIALKILGFVKQGKEDPKRAFQSGLVYALGVLCSFAVIAGIAIAVKGAGSTASWGMHMQNPYFRIILTVLMLLVALNLFGLFEVTLGGRALDGAAQLTAKKGMAGSFFNGILAVVLGASCTAPVLVSAIGYAIPQPPLVILLFFLTIGAGLAFPYVLLSWRPQWLKFLPKPGAWMEKFKIALGFPVLATAVWLFSITTSSGGSDAVWGLGVFLLSLTIAIWIWGEFVQRGSQRKVLAAILAIVLIAFGYAYGLEDQMQWRAARTKQKESGGVILSKGIEWHQWSSAAVEKARAEGHPVLIDFTADWCPNCKANKRRAIDVDSVRQRIKETGTVMMIADFTDEDPVIASELQKFGQSAVPLVVVYPRNPAGEPMVLPTRLTEESVLEALDKAAK
jgi:thiol:disulfide interchange protein/DsbC/DsbD-like thiol-disulfide interchange protein